MVSVNRYEGKDRRRERIRRNHIARDLKSDKYHQRVIPDRKQKFINTEYEVYYDYPDPDNLDP